MQIITKQPYQDRDVAAQQDFLAVPWEIQNDDGTMALEGVQAFPLATTPEEVQDFLSRKLTSYKENLGLHEGAKEIQAGIDNAQQVITQITGITVSDNNA